MSQPPTQESPAKEALDIREKGAGLKRSDVRLYCQLQVFNGCSDLGPLAEAFVKSGLEGVLYADALDPKGVGVLIMSETPDTFVTEARTFFQSQPFRGFARKPELTMFGRTYATGREQDLEDWLLARPRRTALNHAWTWAIWYPLRRKPEFSLLPKAEQGKILMEHAIIGMAYGDADLAHDVRLACHGLDAGDNEFVIGLVGKDLHPLSRIVQDMRLTQQTARYIESLGPFFVGKVFLHNKK